MSPEPRIEWSDDDHAHVRFDRHLPVRMEALWAAVTKTTRLPAWLGPGAVTGGIGGEVRLERPVRGIGSITVWEPGWTLEYEWTAGGRPAGIVRWDFERDATGSGVILLHRRVPHADVDTYITGWAAALDALEAYVGPGPGR